MTECKKIGKALRNLFYTHDYRLHNVFMYRWECDFWCKSTSGYAIEVEIKISRSDFKADFKKKEKHIALGKAINCPNKFYYACPTGLLDVSEIPSYAGLIYFDGITCTKVKDAPFINKEKQNYTGTLLSKYYGKNISLINKIIDFRNQFTYGLSDEKKAELNRFISTLHFDD